MNPWCFSNFVVFSWTYFVPWIARCVHEFATFDPKKGVEFHDNLGKCWENVALLSSRVSNSPFGGTTWRMSQPQQKNCSLRMRKTRHFFNKFPNYRGIRLVSWGRKWRIHGRMTRNPWYEIRPWNDHKIWKTSWIHGRKINIWSHPEYGEIENIRHKSKNSRENLILGPVFFPHLMMRRHVFGDIIATSFSGRRVLDKSFLQENETNFRLSGSWT